ncbi:MAG: VanZ family protein [Cyanobacteria bacterium J06649_4]
MADFKLSRLGSEDDGAHGKTMTGKQAPSKKVVLLGTAYGLFFLVILVLAYTGNLPIGALSRFHNFDKVGHLVLYFIPSYLGHQLCRYRHIRQLRLPVFPSLFALFTIAEELVQGFSPNRTLDTGDMVCSLVGIGVGYWLAQRQARSIEKL